MPVKVHGHPELVGQEMQWSQASESSTHSPSVGLCAAAGRPWLTDTLSQFVWALSTPSPLSLEEHSLSIHHHHHFLYYWGWVFRGS